MSDSTVLMVNTFAAYIGVIPFMIIFQIAFRKYRLPRRHQFGLYLYTLVICSIFMASNTPSLYQINFSPSFNFIPFYGFSDSFSHYMQSLFVFVPFGFLLPTLWKQFRPLKKTFFAALLFSVLIELSQIFCIESTTVTDVTDVIMNIFGTMVGYFVFLQAKDLHFMRRMHLQTKNPRRRTLSKWEVYIYFFTPWLITFLLTPFISNMIWDVIWDTAVGIPI